LSRIEVRVGSLVGPSNSAALTTISGDGDVYAYFSFDEKNLAPLRRAKYNSGEHNPAGKSNIELILADGHTYGHKGKMESASGIIDRTTGSIQLKVVFPNPNNEILSGSSGVVKIPATYGGCITVPQSATYELQDKIMIYVVNADNTVTRKIITIEGTSGKDYVVSGGLKTGDRIVIEGADKLKDGMTITPKE
jgi:membrane fusion protein (multidrug efflux system)